MRTICVVPALAAVGVHENVVEKGLTAELPLTGANTEPVGALIVVMVIGVMAACVPIVAVVKSAPTLATKVPEPAQTGGGGVTISSMRSIAVELSFPPCVDSSTRWRTYCSPGAARVRSHVTRHCPPTLESVGTAPPLATAGITWLARRPVSAAVPKRHVTTSPSGSAVGKMYVRTAPICCWMIAGAAETGPPVFPAVRSTKVWTV